MQAAKAVRADLCYSRKSTEPAHLQPIVVAMGISFGREEQEFVGLFGLHQTAAHAGDDFTLRLQTPSFVDAELLLTNIDTPDRLYLRERIVLAEPGL